MYRRKGAISAKHGPFTQELLSALPHNYYQVEHLPLFRERDDQSGVESVQAHFGETDE
jgi:hypothetical protein